MANEALGTCEVSTGGKTYRHMLSMNLRISRQDATPSGTIVLSWPIGEAMSVQGLILKEFFAGAEAEIKLDGQLAASVRFDTRISKGTPKNYTLTLTFRGRQSINVDNSAKHDTGQWNNETAAQILQSVMAPGTRLIDRSGSSAPIDRFILAAGETVERFGRRLTNGRSLNFWEDHTGAWVLESLRNQGGGLQVLPAEIRLAQQIVGYGPSGFSNLATGGLALGRDFTQWQVKANISPRYGNVTLLGAGIANDERYGKQNENPMSHIMRQFFQDGGKGRELLTLAETPQDFDTLQKVTDYNADMRDKQSVQATLKMSTWSDSSGQLWRLGDTWHVSIPVDQVDDDLVIDALEYELTKDSRSATLLLTGQAGAGGGLGDVFGSMNVGQYLAAEPQRGPGQQQALPPLEPVE